MSHHPSDPELFGLLAREADRQANTISLIASENHCSAAVREACASVLTDKYAEGYPGARYYGGCEVADQVERLAQERALQLFPGMAHANVQAHSGTSANLAVLEALAGRGGRIVGMKLSAGGHLSHGYPMSHTGKLYAAEHYGVDPESGLLRYDEVREVVQRHRPQVVIAGASSYPRAIDFATMRGIADEVGALLLADIAHPAGLIASGEMPSPVGYADVVTMTTHKTLRGPRGGLILTTADCQKKIDGSVFPGGQGGPLMHQIAAKAVAFGEALTPAFRSYAAAVRTNAAHLAECLAEQGLKIVTGGTDSHMVVVDLRGLDVTGADVEKRGLAAGLTINKNMVPGDPLSPRVTSGIRVGTAAPTTRGMDLDAMTEISALLVALIREPDPEALRPRVQRLCDAFPIPGIG
ncbi:MAG: serine hydroxymethyltransferase [Planctomycetes bacterium]|nr:serine hydroxymethyltransferase [Planctomycetota bacterium]